MAELCFKVPAMADGGSVKAITTAIRGLGGISEIQIDLHTRWVVITGHHIDSDAIRQALHDAGYEGQL
jgi:copper chaperone CopZ